MIRLARLLFALITFTLIGGCVKTPTGSTQPNVNPDSSIQSMSAEAIANPDSTIQISVFNFPDLSSWRIYRQNGTGKQLLAVRWNSVYYDTSKPFSSTMEYSIEVIDKNKNLIKSLSVSATMCDSEKTVGLILPNTCTRWVEGEPHHIWWNPQSFPGDSIQIKVIYENYEYIYDSIQTENSGQFTWESGQEFWPFGDYLIPFSVTITLSSVQNSGYQYSVSIPSLIKASSTDSINIPKFLDTVRIGTVSPLAWNPDIFNGPIGIILFDSQKAFSTVINSSYANNGENTWIVPNVAPGIYYLGFYSDSPLFFVYSMPFIIAN